LLQITRTTPRRRTILHLSQIRLTDARTFMGAILELQDCRIAGLQDWFARRHWPRSPFLATGFCNSAILQSCNSRYLLNDPSPPRIDRRHLHANPIADQHTDEIPVDLPREVRHDVRTLIELDAI
jgi:hypothetical protein